MAATTATSAQVAAGSARIDATFRGTGRKLEWDLHVAAGADPAVAGMTVTGEDQIEVDGDRATIGHRRGTSWPLDPGRVADAPGRLPDRAGHA